MAMIVLEGQNNVGKSTLVDWACERYDLPRFHHAGDGEEEASFVREHLARWGDSRDVAIFDRFYWTYLAYPSTGNWKWGKALPPTVTPEFQTETEAQLRAMQDEGKLLLIHAAIPLDALMTYEVGLNPAVKGCEADFKTLGDAFTDVLSGWQAWPYDYTDPESVRRVRERIAAFVEERHG